MYACCPAEQEDRSVLEEVIDNLQRDKDILEADLEKERRSAKDEVMQLKIEIERLMKEDQNKFEAIEKELECAICYEMCAKVISLNCTHVFCESCINMWKRQKQQCPTCREVIHSESSVRVLNNVIAIVGKRSQQTSTSPVRPTTPVGPTTPVRPPPTLISNDPSDTPTTPVRPPPILQPNAPIARGTDQDRDRRNERRDYSYQGRVQYRLDLPVRRLPILQPTLARIARGTDQGRDRRNRRPYLRQSRSSIIPPNRSSTYDQHRHDPYRQPTLDAYVTRRPHPHDSRH